MSDLTKRIKKIKRESEKKFLLDAYEKTEKYVEKEDKQALDDLIARLNGIYDGLSDESRKLANLIIQEIHKEVNELWLKL